MAQDYGRTAAGEAVQAVTLAAGDLEVRLLTLGAILQSVRLAGVAHDLTLGSVRIVDYEGPMRYHGAIVGPVANRITGARAVIAGVEHRFQGMGDPPVTLHSGDAGIHAKVWALAGADAGSAVLTLDLPAGEGGFPGNRRIEARFAVLPPATLRLTLTARTDAPTLMNLANHSYWNLDGTPDWGGHRLRVLADRVLAHHADGRVAGPVLAVAGTGFDLREGAVMQPDAPPLDHNFCLADTRRPLTEALVLTGTSGLSMTVATTEPGIQVYDGRAAIRPGHGHYEGLAIEPQFWPDAPAHGGYPSITLAPGQDWQQVSEWRFAQAPAA
ncbi:MAG: aldose epimerase family protein [Gemmobacter sp.]